MHFQLCNKFCNNKNQRVFWNHISFYCKPIFDNLKNPFHSCNRNYKVSTSTNTL